MYKHKAEYIQESNERCFVTSEEKTQIGKIGDIIDEQKEAKLQINNIVTDIEDLKINNGGGNAIMDDAQINNETTWSSDKISTWSMEQDGVFWAEKEGNIINADDTYVYKLKEIEIFGDTWQDADSKNLIDESLLITKKELEKRVINFENGKISTSILMDFSFVKEEHFSINLEKGDYTLSMVNIENPNSIYCSIIIEDDTTNHISLVQPNATIANFSLETNKDIKIFTNTLGEKLGNLKFNIQLEKGTLTTPYEPYHKADLSNIQHAGELYVDEEGQPILDDQGREQYKFDIMVRGSNILDKRLFERIIKSDNALFYEFTQEIKGSDLERDMEYYFKRDNGNNVQCLFYYLDENLKYIQSEYFYAKGVSYTIRKRPSNAKYYQIQIRPFGNNPEYNNDVENFFNNKYDIRINMDTWDKYVPYEEPHKTTILLPCQLSKVGNVKDRLFWDESKGKYVVEKIIIKEYLVDLIRQSCIIDNPSDGTVRFYTSIKSFLNMASLVSNYPSTLDWTKPGIRNGANDIGITFIKDDSITYNKQWFIDYCNTNNIYFYSAQCERQHGLEKNYLIKNMIETNITEPIQIPTYVNKTNVYVSNINNAKSNIKAKFPLKTDSVVTSIETKTKELKETNLQQDELIDVNLMATDEIYTLLEPLLTQVANERMVSKMVDLYVVMVQRGLKTIDQVPVRYREQVKGILAQLEK